MSVTLPNTYEFISGIKLKRLTDVIVAKNINTSGLVQTEKLFLIYNRPAQREIFLFIMTSESWKHFNCKIFHYYSIHSFTVAQWNWRKKKNGGDQHQKMWGFCTTLFCIMTKMKMIKIAITAKLYSHEMESISQQIGTVKLSYGVSLTSRHLSVYNIYLHLYNIQVWYI